MSRTIHAVFQSGVFQPLEPVELPDGTPAEVTPLPQTAPSDGAEPLRTWPPGYFEQTAGALAGEEFERPPQGDLPLREVW